LLLDFSKIVFSLDFICDVDVCHYGIVLYLALVRGGRKEGGRRGREGSERKREGAEQERGGRREKGGGRREEGERRREEGGGGGRRERIRCSVRERKRETRKRKEGGRRREEREEGGEGYLIQSMCDKQTLPTSIHHPALGGNMGMMTGTVAGTRALAGGQGPLSPPWACQVGTVGLGVGVPPFSLPPFAFLIVAPWEFFLEGVVLFAFSVDW
jgi:hypothetical protein